MPNAIIAGTGSYAPEYVVPNQYFDRVGSNDQWIQERLGIRERRISQGETTSDLAAKAAMNALDMAGMDAAQLDDMVSTPCSYHSRWQLAYLHHDYAWVSPTIAPTTSAS